jgi:hypothetical protein
VTTKGRIRMRPSTADVPDELAHEGESKWMMTVV